MKSAMNKTKPVSNEFDVKREIADGQIASHRKMLRLSDGSYFIKDEVNVEGEGIAPFIVGASWLIEFFELDSGEFYFFRDDKEVRAQNKRFVIFYPPFSIVKACVKNMKGRWQGIAGLVNSFPANIKSTPLIFESDFNDEFTCAAQLKEILDSSRNSQSIEMNPNPSLLSIKAKRLIDENYLIYPSIARIAARLKVSHEHLTRQFKRDFQMSPNAYLHQVRIADATFRLSVGEEIIKVSGDVGYNDLSRFYKQFRKATAFSPGNCRHVLKGTK